MHPERLLQGGRRWKWYNCACLNLCGSQFGIKFEVLFTVMKKQTQSSSVRSNIAAKRRKRALRSKAKKKHRQGTGFRDVEES